MARRVERATQGIVAAQCGGVGEQKSWELNG
jgi:hypothetical protein